MMDVLKQLKLLTMDLCWIHVDDAVTLSVQAKGSAERARVQQIVCTPVKYLNMLAQILTNENVKEGQLRLLLF